MKTSARALRAIAITAACAATGCPEESSDAGGGGATSATSTTSGPSCPIPFQGDPALDPVMEVIVNGVGGVNAPLAPGGQLPLIFPPQGGRVAFVGVRATNIDPCGATLVGSLRDKTSNQSRFEARTVNLTPTGTGFAESYENDISSFANIPLCPNQWSDTDLEAAIYELQVEVRDRRGKSATARFDVQPACLEQDRLVECRCLCDADYVLGQMCEGGASSSSSAASSSSGGNP